ncbi:hypothetical protein MMC20_001486 [Loxospora ochrophaea]|nr:hypothetical protein [Loxospora ochrophaea]
MSTLSPHNNHGDQGDQGASSNSYSGDSPRSPLNLNLGFLKGLADRKTTRDGQPAKRRGPKPDSKPALTRRQELNRQAQRTHRERKEVYIKALEEQVGRLKETFSVSSQEKNSIKEENQKLKELLRIHGIPYHSSNQSGQSLGPGPDSWGGNSAGSQYGGYNLNAQSFSPPTTSFSSDTPPSMHEAAKAGNELIGGPQRMHQQPGMDHDQLGIDFVLTSVNQQHHYPTYVSHPPRNSMQ